MSLCLSVCLVCLLSVPLFFVVGTLVAVVVAVVAAVGGSDLISTIEVKRPYLLSRVVPPLRGERG